MNRDYFNLHSSNYETLMRRAYKTKINTKLGISSFYIEELMNTEENKSFTSILGSYEKQLERIKKYLNDAIFKFCYMNELSDSTNVLYQEKIKLNSASSVSEINSIIEKLLDITQTVKH